MPLRSRDIDGLLRNKGKEKGIIYAISALAEDNSILRQEVKELAAQLTNMAEIVMRIAQYNAETMKLMEKVGKIAQGDDIDDDNTFQGGNG